METITIPMQLVPNLQPTARAFQEGIIMVTPNLHSVGFDLAFGPNPEYVSEAVPAEIVATNIVRLYSQVLNEAGEDPLASLPVTHKLLQLISQTAEVAWSSRLYSELEDLAQVYQNYANTMTYVKVYPCGKIELKDLPKLEIIKRQSHNRNGMRVHVSTVDENRVFIEAGDYVASFIINFF